VAVCHHSISLSAVARHLASKRRQGRRPGAGRLRRSQLLT
jgi:hypothetical protein